VRIRLRKRVCAVPAKPEVSEPRRDESILPISGDFSEPRGGGAWIAAGVCALALSAFFSIKVKPVDPSPPAEPAWAATAPAAVPEPVAAAAKDELDANKVEADKVTEQAMPLVSGAAQAEPAAEIAAPAAPQAEPAAAPVATPRAASTSATRRARREEMQRRGHEFTLALNLGSAAQDTSQPAESQVAAAPSTAPEAPAPVVTAPAPKSPIPDNPY
jgi:hypothetical protein